MKKRLSTPCQHFLLWVLYWTKLLISFTAATGIAVKPFQLPSSFLWWSHIHTMVYLEITISLNTCSLQSCEYAQNSRAGTAVTSEWILKCYQPTNENVIITDEVSRYQSQHLLSQPRPGINVKGVSQLFDAIYWCLSLWVKLHHYLSSRLLQAFFWFIKTNRLDSLIEWFGYLEKHSRYQNLLRL